MLEIHAPLQSHIVQCLVQPGDAVTAGQLLMVLEAMKMEHEITAPVDGEIRALHFSEGEAVGENDVLVTMQKVHPLLHLSCNKNPSRALLHFAATSNAFNTDLNTR